MPKNYTLTFVDGVAENISLPVGTYSYISNTISGYSGGQVDSFTVSPDSTEINLQISAIGVLKITVKDDLDTLIESGSMQLSNSDGTVTYGTAETIEAGAVEFANLPFDTNGISLYVKQDTSDASHLAIPTPQAINMTANPQEETVLNERKPITLKVTVVDKNYANITSINGDLTVNG